ncbi:hypothetical protein BpHYR1_039893 [Brachionus plicatilis]|uniref:Uncharacterized protein n=1 Tax=Brachionus plicatilis TaxID=10195 RepID=A0A3M7RW10_BRAPC|nr:hypothetical protein BpHYR1_039893 [Brachionus plicatilis]
MNLTDIEIPKQFIDCINSARDLIRKRLTQPNLLPPDRKMVDLIDELIKKKISKPITVLIENNILQN